MRRLVFYLALILIFTIAWEGLVRFPGLGTLAKLIGLVLAVCWAGTVVATGRSWVRMVGAQLVEQ